MVLIAPDKFKGTLTAVEAADAIACALRRKDVVKAPMADGGEGTARVICRGQQWDAHDCYYVDRHTRTAVIDSSAVIGLGLVPPERRDVLRASSAPLGVKVREIIQGGCERVIIGVGGTATCDGGVGFLEGLGMEKYRTYKDRLLGLCDVQVPLVAPPGEPSALMFAPQKGASELDLEILRNRLEEIQRQWEGHHSPFDGAGGGLGFALATAIGARCCKGAEYVLRHYGIRWDDIDLVITGEGCIDKQTATGKVVYVVVSEARSRGIPVIAIGGMVEEGIHTDDPGLTIISTQDYLPSEPLTSQTARKRLAEAIAALGI